MAWHGMVWSGFTDRTLAHPLNCRGEVVVRLSTKCRTRVLNHTGPLYGMVWYGIVCMYITVITYFLHTQISSNIFAHMHMMP